MQEQIQTTFDTTTSSSHDDFLDQMLSTLPSFCWDLKPEDENTNPADINNTAPFQFDESTILVSKLRQHQITNAGGGGGVDVSPADKILMIQQQMQQILPLLRGGDQNDVFDAGMEGLYNGFGGSLHGSGQTLNQFNHSPVGGAQNFGAPATGMVSQAPATSSAGGAPGQPRQRVRARRGQATDPHSIAERLRRERIAERMKALQELVPNGNKTDKASMLDEIIDYVKFLQLQVKVLSMSRLGGASAVAPLGADRSSEANGGSGRRHNGTQTVSESNVTVTEHQVAKLMEEDMGSAMQYLQGKGLCLMPISLATAISSATRNPLSATAPTNHNSNGSANGEGPSSPSVSALTVQSAATSGNGTIDGSLKNAASVSKS